MREMSSSQVRELADDIESELTRLARLEFDIPYVQREIGRDAEHRALLFESLALKLHNFYTGCERIFQLVASELNGAVPLGYDWHKRLLDRMSAEREGRPAVISAETAHELAEYLAFRHVVRNSYGFELDEDRVERLASDYPPVWQQFASDVRTFVDWLRDLADQLEQGPSVE